MRKKEILPFVTTWKDREGIMLSKISQRKQILQDITCTQILENKQTHKNRE